MRLQDCELDIDQAWIRPPSRTAPESEWTQARDQNVIPEYLYRFYCSADYFSIDKAPRFLNDPNRRLFSLLGAVVRGMWVSFEESHELLNEIRELDEKAARSLKEKGMNPIHASAVERQHRLFRYLVVTTSAILDQMAEVVALLFHSEIAGLRIGRAHFTYLRSWVDVGTTRTGILSAKSGRLGELRNVLKQELRVSGPDNQWHELLTLYRNKLGHLGMLVFPIVAFHNKAGKFYYFTPSRFPLFHQSTINAAGTSDGTLRDYVLANYIEQDFVSYCASLVARIQRLVDRSFVVLCGAFNEFRNFELDVGALENLNKQTETVAFKSFV